MLPENTFIVEAGISNPKQGGVRGEENMAVTEDRVNVLTVYPREVRAP